MFKIKSHPIIFMLVISVTSFILSACGETLTDADYLARAKDSQDKGDMEGSIIYLKNALSVNPDNIEARLNLGQIYVDIGSGPDAEKELRRAMKLGLDAKAVNVPLARALLMQDKFDAVLELATDSEAIDKEQLALLSALQGHAYLGLDDIDKAEGAYVKAQSLNANEPEAYLGMARLSLRGKDRKTAGNWIARALEIAPDFAGAWSVKGDLARTEGDVEQAELAYTQAINYSAKKLELYYKRAVVRISMGNYKGAELDVAEIRRINPKSPSADYAQGLMLFNKETYPAARESFQQVVALADHYMPAVYYLGVTNYILGDMESAYHYLLQYANFNHDYVPAQQMLAMVEIQNKNYEAARRRITPLLVLLPDDLLTLRLMSKIAIAQGDSAEAIEYLKKEIEQRPESASGYARIGMAMLMEGEDEEAALQLQKAIELDDDSKLIEFMLILHLLSQEKTSEALAAANKYVLKYPDSAMGLNLLGLLQLKDGQRQQAKMTFEKILHDLPGEPGAAHNLAILEKQDGNLEHAVMLYRSVLDHNPRHLRSAVYLAGLLFQLNRDDEARKVLEGAIAQEPDILEPRLFLAKYQLEGGDAGGALNTLQPVMQKSPNHPLLLYIKGKASLMTNDGKGAVDAFVNLARVRPNSAEVHYLLAMSYYRMGMEDQMTKALIRSLEINPNHKYSNIALAGLLVRKNKVDDAIVLLDKLEKLNPELPDIYVEKAKIALLRGQLNEAIISYKKLAELAPDSDVITKLALVQIQAGQTENSFSTLREWLLIHPDDIQVRYNLGSSYYMLGRIEDARTEFLRIITDVPDHALTLNYLAWLYRQGDPKLAREYAERALELSPDSPNIMQTLAIILIEQDMVQQAVILLKKAHDIKPDDPNITYHYALALASSGEKENARRLLSRILSEDRRFQKEQEAKKLLGDLKE